MFEMNPHDLHAFCVDRLARGRMEPQVMSRFARLFAKADRAWMASHAPARPHSDRPVLRARLVAFGEAAAFVTLFHRHLAAPVSHVFSVGAFHDGRLCGVAVAGRPVARRLDDGATLEITRVATDGTRNACSKLLAAVRAEARKRAFSRVVTYTLPQEGGASLRAAAFTCDGPAGGGRWSRAGRVREDVQPLARKTRWIARLPQSGAIASMRRR
jgi:hypothetical protein